MSTDKKHDQTKTLDLRGLMCPEPVLRTKKILDQKPEGAVEVLVDSDINVMNLTRLANSLGLSLQSKQSDKGYVVVIESKRDSQESQESQKSKLSKESTITRTSRESETTNSKEQENHAGQTKKTSVVFIAKDTFGEGDREFSVNLLNVFLQTILQAGHRPQAILLANTGVRLMDPDSSIRKVLDDFKAEGVEVFACGLCVEFYGLKDKVKPEQITNMYAISEYLFSADKVISP
ncbi:MAG: sulfurtransferase-like selenium metabolism protein YedF [Candidatus Melainabacteria bacterium]|nr:MAG: sulfurtransferase-like selenium metabolism protein YedF [Candidatus Melainabacteria bacterium]